MASSAGVEEEEDVGRWVDGKVEGWMATEGSAEGLERQILDAALQQQVRVSELTSRAYELLRAASEALPEASEASQACAAAALGLEQSVSELSAQAATAVRRSGSIGGESGERDGLHRLRTLDAVSHRARAAVSILRLLQLWRESADAVALEASSGGGEGGEEEAEASSVRSGAALGQLVRQTRLLDEGVDVGRAMRASRLRELADKVEGVWRRAAEAGYVRTVAVAACRLLHVASAAAPVSGSARGGGRPAARSAEEVESLVMGLAWRGFLQREAVRVGASAAELARGRALVREAQVWSALLVGDPGALLPEGGDAAPSLRAQVERELLGAEGGVGEGQGPVPVQGQGVGRRRSVVLVGAPLALEGLRWWTDTSAVGAGQEVEDARDAPADEEAWAGASSEAGSRADDRRVEVVARDVLTAVLQRDVQELLGGRRARPEQAARPSRRGLCVLRSADVVHALLHPTHGVCVTLMGLGAGGGGGAARWTPERKLRALDAVVRAVDDATRGLPVARAVGAAAVAVTAAPLAARTCVELVELRLAGGPRAAASLADDCLRAAAALRDVAQGADRLTRGAALPALVRACETLLARFCAKAKGLVVSVAAAAAGEPGAPGRPAAEAADAEREEQDWMSAGAGAAAPRDAGEAAAVLEALRAAMAVSVLRASVLGVVSGVAEGVRALAADVADEANVPLAAAASALLARLRDSWGAPADGHWLQWPTSRASLTLPSAWAAAAHAAAAAFASSADPHAADRPAAAAPALLRAAAALCAPRTHLPLHALLDAAHTTPLAALCAACDDEGGGGGGGGSGATTATTTTTSDDDDDDDEGAPRSERGRSGAPALAHVAATAACAGASRPLLVDVGSLAALAAPAADEALGAAAAPAVLRGSRAAVERLEAAAWARVDEVLAQVVARAAAAAAHDADARSRGSGGGGGDDDPAVVVGRAAPSALVDAVSAALLAIARSLGPVAEGQGDVVREWCRMRGAAAVDAWARLDRLALDAWVQEAQSWTRAPAGAGVALADGWATRTREERLLKLRASIAASDRGQDDLAPTALAREASRLLLEGAARATATAWMRDVARTADTHGLSKRGVATLAADATRILGLLDSMGMAGADPVLAHIAAVADSIASGLSQTESESARATAGVRARIEAWLARRTAGAPGKRS